MPEPTLPAPELLLLPDGRRLSWSEYGDPTGRPVLYLHGSPSSRIEPLAFGLDRVAHQVGVRLIAPDRPGMGESTYAPGRTIATTVPDLVDLLDHLVLPTVDVLGYSGGGAYAAATAALLPGRVTHCTLAACVAHLAPGLTDGLDSGGLALKRLARDHPRRARLALTATMAIPARIPRLMLAMLARSLPAVDQEALASDEIRRFFPLTVRAAFNNGSTGPTHDLALMTSAWDFDFGAIGSDVDIWQGDEDTFGARPAMAEHLHAVMPHSTLHHLPAGHLSVLTRNRESLLADPQPAEAERPARDAEGDGGL